MTNTRALVLRTAGINCDGETVRALELAGARVDLVHLQRVLDEPARLDDVTLLVIPGGFSYGDDVSAGRVLGLELRHSLSAKLSAVKTDRITPGSKREDATFSKPRLKSLSAVQ